ncbi:hypothetical protein SCHPADRAFT_895964 [Schizopora paradoxa]|uniref:Uncharacterized protein n=1 Tax=Schizopora paradoxa TaxID=27342 RepID=A0A0H2RLS4_9AGAM|nr:hypothetical protein SCHPADRAFT_895964 [Schizopora paradoxa]
MPVFKKILKGAKKAISRRTNLRRRQYPSDSQPESQRSLAYAGAAAPDLPAVHITPSSARVAVSENDNIRAPIADRPERNEPHERNASVLPLYMPVGDALSTAILRSRVHERLDDAVGVFNRRRSPMLTAISSGFSSLRIPPSLRARYFPPARNRAQVGAQGRNDIDSTPSLGGEDLEAQHNANLPPLSSHSRLDQMMAVQSWAISSTSRHGWKAALFFF